MKTFDEALIEVVCVKSLDDVDATVQRQTAFITDMADSKLYRKAADDWAMWAICEIGTLVENDKLTEDEQDAQATQVLCTLVNSVFTWGLNVGRLMEEQKMPDV